MFFARYSRFRILWDIWVKRDPIFPAKKQTIVNGSPEAYKTRVQKFRVYLSKTGWTFGPLCGKRAKITASHRNYQVLGFSADSISGVKYDFT